MDHPTGHPLTAHTAMVLRLGSPSPS
jgi:hypothetical protein